MYGYTHSKFDQDTFIMSVHQCMNKMRMLNVQVRVLSAMILLRSVWLICMHNIILYDYVPFCLHRL